ncbi:hypothetical protein HYW19_00155 [Candidatus Woesearchaeota archaeon]|nr:hypothetical protein [Candidatus Woesearchaeota archaeon]
MKISNHITKIQHLERSALKLSFKEDYEALVEIYMLISAHHINAALHALKIIKENKDVKHNQIFSFLKEGNKLGINTDSISNAMKRLNDLRPSHVYGKGENGETAKNAQECYDLIKETCIKIIKKNGVNEDEG